MCCGVAMEMRIEDKIRFSSEQEVETVRKLRYIDHLARRFKVGDRGCDDNLVPTLVAAAALEGNVFSEEEVLRIVNGGESAFSPKEEDFVRGYYRALCEILAPEGEMSFDESRIVSLHTMLFGGGSAGISSRPRWGVANLLDGNRPTIFSRSRSIVVSNEIRELVEWVLVRLEAKGVHPLVVIAAFVYEFLAIHPFREGKGELSHLLSLLLLRRGGYHWVVSFAPVRLMPESRVAYHRAIKHGMQNRYTSQEDITEWIVYWIDRVYDAARHVSSLSAPDLTEQSPSRRSYLNMRQRRILGFIEKNQPVKVSDIVAYLRKESVNTVKKDLLRMREAGYISTEGVLKGTVYYRN